MNRRERLVYNISGTISPMGVLGAACFLFVVGAVAIALIIAIVSLIWSA